MSIRRSSAIPSSVSIVMWHSISLEQNAGFGFFASMRLYQMIGLPFLFVPINVAHVGSSGRVCCKAAHFLRHQLAVWPQALHEAIRRTVFDDLARFRHHHTGRNRAAWPGDARWRSPCVRASGGQAPRGSLPRIRCRAQRWLQDWRILFKNARDGNALLPSAMSDAKSALHSRGLFQLYRSIADRPPSNTIELPIDAAPHRVEGMACRRSVC
jgi:hypothetical protein